MQPITRETITDRRASAINWSAILAGTAAALGIWGVFQLIGIGAGLNDLDPDDSRSLRSAAVGMTSFSALAPLVAAFVGGWFVSRICASYDRKVVAGHAFIVWGLTTALGVAATAWLATATASTAHIDHHRDAVVDPYRDAAGPLDHPVASPDTARTTAPVVLSPSERLAVAHAKTTGKGLLTLGIAILLSIGTALLGAIVGQRMPELRQRHDTAPYPVPPMDPTLS